MTSRTYVFCLLLVMAAASPKPAESGYDVRSTMTAIQKELDDSVEATRTKDIDRYMEQIPANMTVQAKEPGKTVSRDQLRQDVLRQWSVIKDTVLIFNRIDQIEIQADRATVWTSQRWERNMYERDHRTVDFVVTTQKHREEWREINGHWEVLTVQELGGEIFVNGKPYHE